MFAVIASWGTILRQTRSGAETPAGEECVQGAKTLSLDVSRDNPTDFLGKRKSCEVNLVAFDSDKNKKEADGEEHTEHVCVPTFRSYRVPQPQNETK
jgi:hypothetical protein